MLTNFDASCIIFAQNSTLLQMNRIEELIEDERISLNCANNLLKEFNINGTINRFGSIVLKEEKK
jgi:uncharacterized membrane protein